MVNDDDNMRGEAAKWAYKYNAMKAERDALQAKNQVLLNALKLAEESMGAFVSDHGWSQRDMDNFDTVCAAIAQVEESK